MAVIGAASKFTFEVDGLGPATSVARFDGHESVSQLFHFQLLLTSSDGQIAGADVIGKPALLTLAMDQSEPRHIHGIVSRFEHGEEGHKLSTYQATLVPKVWRLQHRRDSRIFQEMTVPEIIEKVLETAGLGADDYRLFMESTHAPREYCVQYRESDWAFISRLMEEEGICCFFEHSADGHVLVMGDGPNCHSGIVAPDKLPFRGVLGAMAHGESVSRFSTADEVRPGKVSLGDFNFKKPDLSLGASSQAAHDDDLEIYDHPGEYDAPDDGASMAKIRLEEWQAVRTVGQGESGCARFVPGFHFTLAEHSRDACNRKYLITSVQHRGSQPQMGEGADGEGPSYTQSFQVIPDGVPYRPARWTARPTINGVQTAIVVGPEGEEIYTDEHGRVKVHFHWDRIGKRNEKSSCWIRVSQLWAGSGWGAVFIPRIGQEVIVDFVEGDPDRPIIVGRVYHGANVPPYPLPAERTKSTIKSDTSPGGGGSNEIRFEDKKGDEEVYLHGQKDWNILIENDKGQEIGHDEALLVKHDRNVEIGNDETVTIGGNETFKVAKVVTGTVGEDMRLAVHGESSVTIDKDHSESIGKSMTVAVGESKNETVGESSTESVGKNKTVSVDESYSVTVTKDMTVAVSKNSKEEVGEKKTLIVGKELAIQVGDATITVKKNGDITVQGKKITVKGSGTIQVEGKKVEVKSDGEVNVKGSGNVAIKGSKVGVN
jgi:type VI secretion system secreted protein VgrG